MNFFVLLILSLFACAPHPESILKQYTSADLEQIFTEHNAHGCFVIYDLKNDVKLTHNSVRLDSAFLPASTFKIINSMIALETGIVKDEKEIIKWDGKKRFIEIWNQDHNLQTGIKHSVVWFYQELARRIGKERMQKWVSASNYGNENITGNIDLFWLSGDIRITPNQQIDFLKRLYFNELPFSQRNQNIVKDIMIVEESPNHIIRAKTGWAARVNQQIGWYVGYIEKAEDVYFFAINIDIKDKGDAPKRKQIVYKILQKLQLI